MVKTEESEALKISKLSSKPSPIRTTSNAEDEKAEQSSQESTSDGIIIIYFSVEVSGFIPANLF